MVRLIVATHKPGSESSGSQLGQTPHRWIGDLGERLSTVQAFNRQLILKVSISNPSPKKFTFISCKQWAGVVESSLQGLLDVSRCGRSGSRRKRFIRCGISQLLRYKVGKFSTIR
jgi:hypothetical protein